MNTNDKQNHNTRFVSIAAPITECTDGTCGLCDECLAEQERRATRNHP